MASTSNRAERWGDHIAAASSSLNEHLLARHLIFSLLVVVFYLLLNRPEITLVTPELGFTAWYPAAGLVLAVMLYISPRYFPLLVFADALASVAMYHQRLISWSPLVAPVVICGSYAAAAYVLRGPLKIDPALGRRRDVVRYLWVSMTAAVPATLVGVLCLAKDHTLPWNEFWKSAFQWYMGDVIGLVGFAPFLLIFVLPWVGDQLSEFRAGTKDKSQARAGKPRKIYVADTLEAGAQAGSILLTLWIVFGRALGSKELYFLAFVPIIWIAIRHGIRRVAIALLIFTFGIVLALRIFAAPSDLQLKIGLLMLAVCGTGLLVGSEVTERQRVARQLSERTDFLNSLIEHNPLAISIQDGEGTVQFCNDAFTELFLYTREEVVGHVLDPLVRLEESAGGHKERGGGLAFGRPNRRTVRRVRKDRKTLDIELHEVAFDLGNWRSASYAIYRDISEQVKSAAEASEHTESLGKLVSELQTQTMQMTMLNNMGDLLQCCGSLQEAFAVVAQSAKLVLSEATRGALFVFRPSRDALAVASSWGGQPFAPDSKFPPDECWALRRGQAYWSECPDGGVICAHIRNPVPASYLCVPLVAQGETLGVFHVQYNRSEATSESEAFESLKAIQQRLSVAIAGQAALSLASLRLRETLREQSIRDPLTGLFNRRFMQESLTRELLRSKRKKIPLAVVFLDLDHFKRFNDTFGHDAGDTILRSVAEALRTHYRADDVVCRYGGEEFAVILPESTAEEAAKRSEGLRTAVKQLRVGHDGKLLDGITLSMGIAAFPEHASSEEELLRLADTALYESKSSGRDRITVAAKG